MAPLDHAQLRSGLGLRSQDITVLRAGNEALRLAYPGTEDTTNGARHTRCCRPRRDRAATPLSQRAND
jgi:hypothetical protein